MFTFENIPYIILILFANKLVGFLESSQADLRPKKIMTMHHMRNYCNQRTKLTRCDKTLNCILEQLNEFVLPLTEKQSASRYKQPF
jgi:hypothetical protein